MRGIYPQLESIRSTNLEPLLNLSSDIPVSKFAFKRNVYRYVKLNRAIAKMLKRDLVGADYLPTVYPVHT
jgi:hypothetical protein